MSFETAIALSYILAFALIVITILTCCVVTLVLSAFFFVLPSAALLAGVEDFDF